MKNKKIIAICLFVMGLIIFSYPTVSSYLAKKNQVSVIDHYVENLKDKEENYYEEELAKAIEYNQSLTGDPVKDPFVFDSGYALPDNYLSVLNVNDVMAYIEIPKINVKLPIYHGSTEETLSKGIGHVESTSLPIGGESQHAILTGHRGLPNAKLFTDLNLLKEGDHFYISYLDKTIAYMVDKIEVVKPEDLKDLAIEYGQDYISLITCTPYGINTHRLVVRGTRVQYVPEKKNEETTNTIEKLASNIYQIIGIILGILILLIGLLAYKVYRSRKGKKSSHV